MIYIVVFIASVFMSSVSQILLKKSAGKSYESALREYLNPLVIIAYGLFFGSTLVTVIAYKYVPLSMGPILEATGYIFVTVLGYFILKESVSRKKVLGIILILAGIVVYNL